MTIDILDHCKRIVPRYIEIRRDIHRHPEVGFDVHRTAALVAAELENIGVDVRTGVGQSGVVGDLRIPGAQRCVALRADMDALPMNELGKTSYTSTVEGAAHMCGHDSHTAMLLGAANVLFQHRHLLKINVRFIFQPNEENLPGGAPAMIADGVLEGVDEIYGLHVWPLVETQHFGVRPGPMMGRPDVFKLKIIGRGGHASLPHMAIDPLIVGAEIVTALQTIVARSVDPSETAVLSVTQFHAGSTHNVIPHTATIEGTIRTYKNNVQEKIRQRLTAIIEGVCRSHGATFELDYIDGYPVLVNDPDAADYTCRVIRNLVPEHYLHTPCDPVLGGEDFAYYLKKVPGCFAFLGVRNETKEIVHMCHDPRFDIDEDAMPYGMALHVAWVMGFS